MAKLNGTNLGKLGGLTRSPLADRDQLLTALASIVNSLDELETWTDLETAYVRDFIQGMWIAERHKEIV